MKIELEEPEIITAIIEYVSSQGFTIDKEKAEVDLKAGRKDNGMTATISMNQGKIDVKVKTDPAKPTIVEKSESTKEPKDSKKLSFGSD